MNNEEIQPTLTLLPIITLKLQKMDCKSFKIYINFIM
jgi:hypothetical protein